MELKTLISKVKTYLKGTIDNYSDNSFVYFSMNKPLSTGYFPTGRFVFNIPQKKIESLTKELLEHVKTNEITAFKYAIKPLPEEVNPAVIIYTQNNKEKKRAETILTKLEISNYEWRKGNNITQGNFNANFKETGQIYSTDISEKLS